MRVQVLGEVTVLVDGHAVTVSSRSQRIVLAVLAARAGTNVSVDLLVDALWPDDPPRTAVRSLRTYVSRLRHHLGDVLTGTPGGYRLDVGSDELDLLRFEDLISAADGAPAPVGTVALLDEALALWRGAPFGDVGDVEALRPSTTRLEEEWVGAREARLAALVASGRSTEVVVAAEELLATHPLRERAWASLVEGLSTSGRATEALRAYQRAVEALADAGLEPTAALRHAESAALTRGETPSPRRPLAVPASSFIGRAGDRDALAGHITRCPLVTLVGPGGVGKTRLARVVASDVEHRFAAGARLVQLAGVEDPAQVASVIASGLELTIGTDGVAGALAAASALDVLVVIDNCEHVITAAADAIGTLASGGGPLRVLATSREPLSIDGEQLWPVAPLPVDGPDGATQLFVDRVAASRPGFAPDDDARHLIHDIVGRLDGLPLAVEMAAAATRVMSLPTLADRLADELVLPAMTRRDLDERQRTLGALVDWSLRLLDEEGRALFTSLAVFTGSVGAADVAVVCDHPEPFDVLCRLADHSLIQVDASGEDLRFGMLQTVRQRALDLHRDLGPVRVRHARWVLDAVCEADQGLRTTREARAHARIESLLPDARAAMAWMREHDIAGAVALAGHLYLFGQSRLRDEVLEWSAQLADDLGPELEGPNGQLVLTAAAQRAINTGDIRGGERLARRAVALGGSAPDPLATEVLSDVHLFAGRSADSIEVARAGLAVSLEVDDPHAVVMSLANLVLASAYTGDHEAASQWMRQLPDPSALAPSDAAWVHYLEGERTLDADPRPALAALARAIDMADGVGNAYLASLARVSYASLLSRTGEPDAARGPFVELLAHWRSHGDRTHLLTTLRNLVISLDRMGQHERAAELLGTVLDETLAPTYGTEREMLLQVADRLEHRLGRAELDRRRSTGRARSVDDAARVAQRWLTGDAGT